MKYVSQVIIGVFLLVSSATLQATPIYSIDGVPDGLSTLGPGALSGDQGAATSFVLTSAFSNVDITIPIDCLACTGSVFLSLNSLGPGTTLADTIFLSLQTLISQTVFSGLSLGPGQYYVGIAVESGLGTWQTSTSPILNTVAGTQAPDPTQFFAASLDPVLAAASPFSPDLAASNALLIGITGDIVSVPEPGSLILLLTGLMLIRMHRSIPA